MMLAKGQQSSEKDQRVHILGFKKYMVSAANTHFYNRSAGTTT